MHSRRGVRSSGPVDAGNGLMRRGESAGRRNRRPGCAKPLAGQRPGGVRRWCYRTRSPGWSAGHAVRGNATRCARVVRLPCCRPFRSLPRPTSSAARQPGRERRARLSSAFFISNSARFVACQARIGQMRTGIEPFMLVNSGAWGPPVTRWPASADCSAIGKSDRAPVSVAPLSSRA
jgi:hypothetical protein